MLGHPLSVLLIIPHFDVGVVADPERVINLGVQNMTQTRLKWEICKNCVKLIAAVNAKGLVTDIRGRTFASQELELLMLHRERCHLVDIN